MDERHAIPLDLELAIEALLKVDPDSPEAAAARQEIEYPADETDEGEGYPPKLILRSMTAAAISYASRWSTIARSLIRVSASSRVQSACTLTTSIAWASSTRPPSPGGLTGTRGLYVSTGKPSITRRSSHLRDAAVMPP